MILLDCDEKRNKKLFQIACEASGDDSATFVLKHYGAEDETFTVNRLADAKEWISHRGYNESRERLDAIDQIMSSVKPLGSNFFRYDDDCHKRLEFALGFQKIDEVRFTNKNGEQETVKRFDERAKVDLGPYDPYF